MNKINEYYSLLAEASRSDPKRIREIADELEKDYGELTAAMVLRNLAKDREKEEAVIAASRRKRGEGK